ncbi:MAG TPA: VOC family protein [Methylotenera sp.]|nr:VOC family protein [Methylotenera sp.]
MTQIYINLPVKDLNQSIEFFTKLGFTFEPKFTDENATCMIVDENIFVMLLVESFFKTFTSKQLCDTKTSTEVLLALSYESRNKVNDMVSKAVKAGAKTPHAPKDLGFMYQHGFEDLDGHYWELFHMEKTE